MNIINEPFFRQITTVNTEPVVLCLPYAGTGSAIFSGWRDHPLRSAEIVVVQLPGRDSRLSEPAVNEMDTLVNQIADAVLAGELADRPLSILGCSFGAVVGFELARELDRRQKPIDHLIAAASRAPHNTRVTEPIASLSDDEMVMRLRHWYGALPAEIAENQSMLDTLLPTIRADMQLYETYEHQEAPALPCPITAIGGADDPIVTIGDLTKWKELTSGKFASRQFAGDHFFMRSDFKAPLRLIDRKLAG